MTHPERNVEEAALEHAYPATQFNTQRVVAVSRVQEIIKAERKKREEMVKEAYKAGKQSFLKDIRKFKHKEIGSKCSYIILDEV